MPRPPVVPEELLLGPFTRQSARAAGLSDRQLQGRSFERVFPSVWRHRDHAMSSTDWRDAAMMTLPDRAALSHVSRIQDLGLDIGPVHPVHATIAGDLHRAIDGIFLHRTEVMPPHDDDGVFPAVAFIQCCASMRLLDVLVIGDFLLHQGLATPEQILAICAMHPWRPGAAQAPRVLPWLDERSRSPKESELRAYVVAAGLPQPEVNVDVLGFEGQFLGIADLWFRRWRLALEYEGRQHAETTRQFQRDIDRYAGYRENEVAYLQFTASMTPQPTRAVQRVFEALVRQGFDGPPPVFGPRWGALFQAVPVPVSGRKATESNPYSVDELPPPAAMG